MCIRDRAIVLDSCGIRAENLLLVYLLGVLISILATSSLAWAPVSYTHLDVYKRQLKDIVKQGVKEKFADLRKMGIRTIMITGDNPLTAASIAAFLLHYPMSTASLHILLSLQTSRRNC